ncbi:hypothetical protein [Caulobacter sp. Root1472]|jgi:hypothetical protein|uniref:hypothetical protein n=1 Tax=Caulobacter sp. Root1472 TaxID=1736470 RepID=UPI0006FD5962|nr:hypothetical protein [Caulobacter sp. Root1472]KQZ27153.1 hypothetical protein ASD47_05425 [Caulobacter sp. Root1472]
MTDAPAASQVRKIRMRPRLAQLMAEKSGGMYVAEALKRADATLETLREPSLTGIDELIVALDALLAAEAEPAARIEGLYQLAANIVGLCGAERNVAVQVAARSLCELLDEADGLSPSILAGVKVHIASIKLLHRAADNPALQGPILQGLASVLEKRRAESKAQG